MANYQSMGKVELRAACKEVGIKYGKLDNEGMRAALKAKEDETAQPVKSLFGIGEQANAEKEVPASVQKPVHETIRENIKAKDVAPVVAKVKAEPTSSKVGTKIEKHRPEQNGVKRPSVGGMCRAVWDFLDAKVAEGVTITAKDVKAWAPSQGWNPNNASIEFYQWRKFHGIRGRQS